MFHMICLGAAIISTGFRKIFHAQRIVIGPWNKVRVNLKSSSFSFLPSLADFHRQRSRQINGVRKKTKESDTTQDHSHITQQLMNDWPPTTTTTTNQWNTFPTKLLILHIHTVKWANSSISHDSICIIQQNQMVPSITMYHQLFN